MKNTFLYLTFLIGVSFCCLDCNNSSSQQENDIVLTSEESVMYLAKGKEVAAASFIALSQQLQKAVKEGGIPNAIQYCNVAALPITDSLAIQHQATIRRTSSKNRNTKNRPTDLEQSVLAEYAEKAKEGHDLKPIVKPLDDQKVVFYAPIKVNGFCLNCHGKLDGTLTLENHQIIKKYYPNDKAIGYVDGELRGIWSIQLSKK